MKCADWKDEIDALVDGSLPPGKAESLNAHLEACEDCRDVVSDLREAIALIKGLPEPEVPERAWPAIQKTITARRRRRRILIPAAAAMLLLIPTAAMLLTPGRTPDLDLEILDVSNGMDATEWSSFMADFSVAGGIAFVPPKLAEEEKP